MTPHPPSRHPRQVEVDLSEILIRPETAGTIQITHSPDSAVIFSELGGHSVGPRNRRIGPVAWTNLHFVIGSCLIALFCTVFIRDRFEYSRRTGHLAADALDLKPEFNFAKSSGFRSSPTPFAAGTPSGGLQSSWFKETTDFSAPAFLGSPQFRADQISPSSPNNGNIADRTASSRSVTSDGAPPARLSRTTSSSAENASAEEQTGSGHSNVTRRARKSVNALRATISSHRRRVRPSVGNGAGISSTGKSMSRPIRQTVNNLKFSGHNGQDRSVMMQIGGDRKVLSMHSLGTSAVGQVGGMNPMRMESGMLAQPAIGPGLGGVTGNGLGGGGNHLGNRAAK